MVARGESIEITDRGRPAALLGPLPTGGPIERLRLAGDIEPASGDFDDLPAPLPSSAEQLPSEVLTGLRQAER